MKKKQTTLLELAKRLNLSPSTVSRALNGRHRISEETRKRVKALADQLEYQPNPSAKSLRESKTYVLGVLVPQIAHEFFSVAISGIEEKAIEAGYSIMICQSHESADRERAVAEALLSSRVDGILVSPSQETKDFGFFRSFLRKDIPVVFFDRFAPDFPAPRVVVNDYGGARQAVEHLTRTGCKRIAHVTGPVELSNVRGRMNGYRDALEAAGYPYDESLIFHCKLIEHGAREAAEELLNLEPRPDAVFCFNDHLAYDVLQAAKRRGIRIPEELSLIGFSDEFASALIEPSLTSVTQPAFELGRTAASLMLEQLQKEEFDMEAEFPAMMLETSLVLRDSCRS
ncbi:MAG: LacI family DNA-binding transcriptional regulator [Bacteroidia bacterium]|nr:LacI family DNA-binding transcriptional regulator [Bacteroidia bacterium]